MAQGRTLGLAAPARAPMLSLHEANTSIHGYLDCWVRCWCGVSPKDLGLILGRHIYFAGGLILQGRAHLGLFDSFGLILHGPCVVRALWLHDTQFKHAAAQFCLRRF